VRHGNEFVLNYAAEELRKETERDDSALHPAAVRRNAIAGPGAQAPVVDIAAPTALADGGWEVAVSGLSREAAALRLAAGATLGDLAREAARRLAGGGLVHLVLPSGAAARPLDDAVPLEDRLPNITTTSLPQGRR